MATSVKRILIMTIAIKLIMIISLSATQGIVFSSEKAFSTSTERLRGGFSEFDNSESGVSRANLDTSTTVLEQQYGDSRLAQQVGFYDYLKKGWGYLGREDIRGDNEFEETLRQGFNWFNIVVNVLIGLEIVYLIWSKKWD